MKETGITPVDPTYGSDDGLMESSGPGGPGLVAVAKVSRKKLGLILAFVGVLGGVAGVLAAGPVWLIWVAVFLPLAALVYSGVSRDSKVWIARGLVFVYPKTIGNRTTGLSESICKPEAVREEGTAVIVLSRWSQVRIVFQTETEKSSFVSEVSSLLKP